MKQLGLGLRELDARMPPDEAPGATIDLRQALAVLRRRRRPILIWMALGLALGILYLLTTPPRYYAASKVLIDEQLSQLAEDVSSGEAAIRDDAALMNEIQVLQSQQLAAAVIDDLGLVADPDPLFDTPSAARRLVDTVLEPVRVLLSSPEPADTAADSAVSAEERQRNALALKLAGDVIVSPVGRSYVIEVGYMSQDAGFAARVANAYAEAYLSDQLVANLDAKRRTAEWMQTRLDQLQAEAQDAALAVETFKAENGMIADQDQTRQRLLAEQEAETVRADLKRAQAVLDAARARPDEHSAADVANAEARVAALEAELAAPAAEVERITGAQVRLRELERRAATLSALVQDFSARRETMTLQDAFPVSSVRILTSADTPKDAAAPKVSRVLPVTTLLGLLLGLGFALRGEFRERFFRTGEDVRDQTGLPFLGYLPLIQFTRRRKGRLWSGRAPAEDGRWNPEDLAPHLFTPLSAPHSMYVEALRNIRVAADLSLPSGCKVMGVLSVLPDEGKTMTAGNYANAIACSGSRVLLIDSDLRHPGLSDEMRLQSGTGIVQVLLKQASLADAVREVPSTGLHVLPCIRSDLFAFAGEMLRLPRMAELLAEARHSYDYVVLDLPPVGAVVDAKILLPNLDCVLLVTEWGRTPRDLVRQQVLRDPHLRGKVIGVALNKVALDELPKFSRIDGAENYLRVYADYQRAP